MVLLEGGRSKNGERFEGYGVALQASNMVDESMMPKAKLTHEVYHKSAYDMGTAID